MAQPTQWAPALSGLYEEGEVEHVNCGTGFSCSELDFEANTTVDMEKEPSEI